jgi:hypothetical protein
MAIQLINVGQIANDGTGDDLREAMIKINANFEELDLRDDEKTSASNIGTVGEGLFVQRLNYDLQFKKIAGGDNVLLVADNEKITVSVPEIGVTDVTISADNGSVVLEDSATLNILGGTDIETTITDSIITIDYTGVSDLQSDPAPTLGNNLDANAYNLLNVGNITASNVTGSFTGNLTGNVTGNITGLVHNIDIRDIWTYFEPGSADFGSIEDTEATNLIEFILYSNSADFGTFINPNSVSLDFGSF